MQNVVAESTRAVPQGYEEPVNTGGGAHSIICRHLGTSLLCRSILRLAPAGSQPRRDSCDHRRSTIASSLFLSAKCDWPNRDSATEVLRIMDSGYPPCFDVLRIMDSAIARLRGLLENERSQEHAHNQVMSECHDRIADLEQELKLEALKLKEAIIRRDASIADQDTIRQDITTLKAIRDTQEWRQQRQQPTESQKKKAKS